LCRLIFYLLEYRSISNYFQQKVRKINDYSSNNETICKNALFELSYQVYKNGGVAEIGKIFIFYASAVNRKVTALRFWLTVKFAVRFW
jgi:hypothetical protein